MKMLKDAAEVSMNPSRTEQSWAQTCAGLGATAWAALAILARTGVAPIGSIELIFLFAPLVIVPLGLELVRVIGASGPIHALARRLQPVAAVLAIVALWLPPGRLAATFASGWMLICGLIALTGVTDLFSTKLREYAPLSTFRFAISVARIDLAVGGAWLIASRLGMRPMGIQEPIGLLTAVHFHFAGFATALIAAAALRFSDSRSRWLRSITLLVVLMPYVIAVGFVTTPQLKMSAGVVFSLSVAALAIGVRSLGSRAQSTTARILLQIAPACVFAGVVLAAVFAILDFRGSDVLPIPQMARTHGLLNAVGFCMCGLLGWLIEFSTPNS